MDTQSQAASFTCVHLGPSLPSPRGEAWIRLQASSLSFPAVPCDMPSLLGLLQQSTVTASCRPTPQLGTAWPLPAPPTPRPPPSGLEAAQVGHTSGPSTRRQDCRAQVSALSPHSDSLGLGFSPFRRRLAPWGSRAHRGRCLLHYFAWPESCFVKSPAGERPWNPPYFWSVGPLHILPFCLRACPVVQGCPDSETHLAAAAPLLPSPDPALACPAHTPEASTALSSPPAPWLPFLHHFSTAASPALLAALDGSNRAPSAGSF